MRAACCAFHSWLPLSRRPWRLRCVMYCEAQRGRRRRTDQALPWLTTPLRKVPYCMGHTDLGNSATPHMQLTHSTHLCHNAKCS